MCYLICPLLLLYIRALLARENKRRDVEPPDEKYEDVDFRVLRAVEFLVSDGPTPLGGADSNGEGL